MPLSLKLPNIVYYNDNHSKTPVCTDKISQVIDCSYTLPSTWEELSREIEHGAEYLAFHVNMIAKSSKTTDEFISAIYTIHNFCHSTAVLKIMAVITPMTTYQTVKTLQRLRITGVGLDINHYSIKETADSARALIAGTPYWPKHIIDQLPGHPSKKILVKTLGINISPRQQQVLDLIKTRGLGNKQIARALGISENTVKMHVGDIMRAHGVKSRTQLAVLS
jgi:hypothetical protein